VNEPRSIKEGWEAEGQADLTNSSFDRDGNLTLTFTIHPESKYDLMPITDIKGRAFRLRLSTASRRVFAGQSGLEEARRRVDRTGPKPMTKYDHAR
jgi:hypothetical protein